MVAIQDRVSRTLNYRKNIIQETFTDDSCRLCKKAVESIEHVFGGCTSCASSDYKERHDQVAKIVHMELAFECGLKERKEAVPYYKKLPDLKIRDEVNATGGPKTLQFPLDRFLVHEKNIKGLEVSRCTRVQRKRDESTENLMKKISELTSEAERIVETCIPRQDSAEQSTTTSSTSLNESGSSYTEHLVEKKFKEVTFKKQKAKASGKHPPVVINSKNLHQTSRVYSPKNYEELNTNREAPTYSPLVEKSLCHHSPASVQKRSLYSPVCSPSIRTEKTSTHRSSSPIDKSNTVTLPQNVDENERYPRREFTDFLPSKLGPSKTINLSCGCRKYGLSTSNNNQTSIVSHKNTSGEGTSNSRILSGRKNSKPIKVTSNSGSQTKAEPERNKLFLDACVNTDNIKTANASLIKVFSNKTVSTSIDSPRPYQIQELPVVNIRPNLTKQIGPIIDIKQSKPTITKTNVAVVECVHSEAVEKKIDANRNEKCSNSEKNVFIAPTTPHVQRKTENEEKLQYSIKELLKRLNYKKGSHINHLKESLNTLLMLLNQITPIHMAPVRILDENIIDERKDLFFSNMNVVTELIENEMTKPSDKFCKYPDYILKAVNFLCNNIRSNFYVKEKQLTFVKSSINTSSGPHQKVEKPTKNYSEERKQGMKDNGSNKTSTTESCFNKVAENELESPRELYIPYRKLVPGGKYKPMEEASSLKELELRRKRLETITKINERLKAELPQKELPASSVDGRPSQKEELDIKEVLNRTFIIESGSEEDEEKLSDKTNTEIMRKSEAEYEDDWEPDPADSISGSDSAPALQKFEVEAQVHKSDEICTNPVLHEASVQTGRISSHTLEEAENNTYSKTEEENSNAVIRKCKGRQTFVTTASQTEDQVECIPLENNVHSSRTKLSTKTEDKQTVEKNVETPANLIETVPFPVLRMTNPITKSLLEVRFPEQTEKFQSSVLVQKSENKEEIKLLYNINNEEKVQTWPRSKNNDSTNSKRHEISGNNSFSDSNLRDKKEEMQRVTPPANVNDFENITTTFIDFLENKVTEMVKKFRSSEVVCEKLFNGRQSRQDHKASSPSLQGVMSDQLNSNMKNVKGIYKSVSSLFSDKTTEELKFHNISISRGCSPDNGRMKIENLISPPLVLKFKHDATSQTDDVLQSKCFSDANVGTSRIYLESESSVKDSIQKEPICLLQNNEASNSVPNEGNEKTIVDSNISNFITVDKNLRLPDISLDVANESHDRLLPLPEDVLKDTNIELHQESHSFCFKNYISEKPLLQSNAPINNNQDVPKQGGAAKDLQTEPLKFEKTSEICLGSEKSKDEVDEETALAQSRRSETSKADDDGDSQGTLQILNILSASDNDNNILLLKRQNSSVETSREVRLLAEPLGKKSCPVSSTNDIQAALKSNQCLEIMNTFFKMLPPGSFEAPSTTELVQQSSSKCVSCTSTSQLHENVHSLFISGLAETNTALSSCNDGNVNHLENQSLKEIKEYPEQSNISHEGVDSRHLIEAKVERWNEELFKETQTSTNLTNAQDIIHASSQLSLEEVDRETISDISDECIPIHYFHSDEMSDGEVRFVYTSNSYSSGEIKPMTNQNLKSPENHSKEMLSEKRDDNTRHELLVTHHEFGSDRQGSRSAEGAVGSSAIGVTHRSGSSNETLSTGELRQILSADDKLDDVAINQLANIHFQYNTTFSSESPEAPNEPSSNVINDDKKNAERF